MKTKLDRYDLSILIKGVYSMRDCYGSEIRDQIYDLLSRLIDIFDNMDPDHKAIIVFDSTEHRIVLHCLTGSGFIPRYPMDHTFSGYVSQAVAERIQDA